MIFCLHCFVVYSFSALCLLQSAEARPVSGHRTRPYCSRFLPAHLRKRVRTAEEEEDQQEVRRRNWEVLEVQQRQHRTRTRIKGRRQQMWTGWGELEHVGTPWFWFSKRRLVWAGRTPLRLSARCCRIMGRTEPHQNLRTYVWFGFFWKQQAGSRHCCPPATRARAAGWLTSADELRHPPIQPTSITRTNRWLVRAVYAVFWDNILFLRH